MHSTSSSIWGALFKVLGRRPALIFGLVTGLVVFLLAAVTVTSRYAMQRYVADQVERVPWDISIYQTAEVPLADKLHDAIAKVDGVARAERLAFLRTIPPYSVRPTIDGAPLRSPWISVLTATEASLVPPDIRPTGDGAVLVLVGSKTQMGDAYLRLQNRKKFELVVVKGEDVEQDLHGHVRDDNQDTPAANQPREVITLTTPLERVIRIDATEINRWFLEQTSSPTLVPELGLILVTPYDDKMLATFDQVSRGFIHHEDGDFHGDPGKYFPEIIHLVRVDRPALVSGWDIDGSLSRITRVGSYLTDEVQEITSGAAVDHNLGAMFVRISDIARKIALISLLVSLPLLLIAGVLLGNLSNLLLLNERRKLGLLRLRGIPGRAIGATLLLAIGLGGFIGGLAGAVLGTIVPLTLYFGSIPPLALIPKIQEPLYLAIFLAVGIAIALATGRRLVREASRVSPLEASRRVSRSEGESVRVRFGLWQFLALAIGGAKFAGWVADRSLTNLTEQPWAVDADRALDFVSFPLLIYGLVTLIASRQKLMSALIAPLTYVMAGPLRSASLRHMEVRRHRAASFLLIVALLTSIALYPTVMIAVFDNKTERGARVQLGSDIQLTLNALDLMPADAQSRGGLQQRLGVLWQTLDPLIKKMLALPQVSGTAVMVEGLVEGLYMPDRGFSGVPIYLIDDTRNYLKAVYSEPALGEHGPFAQLVQGLAEGKVITSSPMGRYYKRTLDQPMPVGRMANQALARLPFGGSIYFLPGVPLRTVNDREGFIGARVDYLNHLFASSPYLVAAERTPGLANLDVLIPRVVISVAAASGVSSAALRDAVLANLTIQPLDVRDINTEVARLGSDMYIYLARQNVQIYLLGGLLLAIIGIFSVAYANYLEDRRTFALLRIRGAGPRDVVRFFLPNVFGPSLVGLVIGALISLAVGFGITKLIWELRQLQTVMGYLPTRLAVSEQTFLIAAILIALVVGIVVIFGRFVFARTARQSLLEG
jgi:ABC-type lipoprotein release transport system permease subunit